MNTWPGERCTELLSPLYFKTWGCLSIRNPPNILKSVEIGQQTTWVFSCHFSEENQSFKCAIPRRINNTSRESNHILTAQTMPPWRTITTHPHPQTTMIPPHPSIEEIWHFASSLLPFQTCNPDFSFRFNPNHPRHLRLQRPRPTKKRTWKTWPAWAKFRWSFFWLIRTKK